MKNIIVVGCFLFVLISSSDFPEMMTNFNFFVLAAIGCGLAAYPPFSLWGLLMTLFIGVIVCFTQVAGAYQAAVALANLIKVTYFSRFFFIHPH